MLQSSEVPHLGQRFLESVGRRCIFDIYVLILIFLVQIVVIIQFIHTERFREKFRPVRKIRGLSLKAGISY